MSVATSHNKTTSRSPVYYTLIDAFRADAFTLPH